mmetsp:Transcript_6693/g.7679  ORF Transcript_6693/g.7679 Transcript_6693/m.7679 type:complete len:440 (-) Transcript_6693:234-1553(-)|eukprot:CAMPEP_0184014832 /NCGR_PEP_ID=MMETSP0954-20121128/5932_1 /TAXON_ID=627963 /ORGANISM="Aplanochytrium sp, Strain PBS07" /LENGTH=439 /DNA_ID=CAMNT_0026295465 /DNA_START=93 /DNA_END=1412 /DNA_ORIENTATION=+
MENIAKRARQASYKLASASTETKNKALAEITKELLERKEEICRANREDKENAEKDKIDAPLQKRLNLEGEKFDTLVSGLRDVEKVADPVGKLTLATKLDDGLELFRVACPIGVLCIIFESRPEAAVQIASLAIKSGNALILKGGKEALHSNKALVDAFQAALPRAGLPADAVQLVSTREDIAGLLKLDKYIDLVIPRGSNALVKHIMNNTNIPVMGHADGICAVYVDKNADLEKACQVVLDAKTQYTAACNTAETLLVHEDVVKSILPKIANALVSKGVKFFADEISQTVLPPEVTEPATEDTYKNEYLDLKMSVKTVSSLEEAVDHINNFGSHHTDCIITEDGAAAEEFMRGVDSAGVFHNCSTRFADGFRFGFGAEVGISTNRIHARGPVGLEGLVTYKYRMHGNGHCVASYGQGKKSYKHESLPVEDFDYRAPKLG